MVDTPHWLTVMEDPIQHMDVTSLLGDDDGQTVVTIYAEANGTFFSAVEKSDYYTVASVEPWEGESHAVTRELRVVLRKI